MARDEVIIGLLPWESESAFLAVQSSFHAEHQPQGATETVLVDRLVWIAWRRRRLELAERAVHMAVLSDRLSDERKLVSRAGLCADAGARVDVAEVVRGDAEDDGEISREHAADRKATARALKILARGDAGAYQRGLDALHDDTRTWWEDGVAGEYGEDWRWTADAKGLAGFLSGEVCPADAEFAAADEARPAVRLQAHGESFDPGRMERLLAIDTRLDRQFEKALSALLQLQQGRKPRPRAGRSVGRSVGRAGSP